MTRERRRRTHEPSRLGRVGAAVDYAYAEALRRGYEIVHPLTDEPWDLRRFFVRAPDGNVLNTVSHRDD